MQIWSSVAVATFKQRTYNTTRRLRIALSWPTKEFSGVQKVLSRPSCAQPTKSGDLFHTCKTRSRLPQAATSQKAPMKARLARAANSVTKLLPITISLATVPADVASAETVHGPPRQAASPRVPTGETRHASNFSPSDDSLEVVATVGALLLSREHAKRVLERDAPSTWHGERRATGTSVGSEVDLYPVSARMSSFEMSKSIRIMFTRSPNLFQKARVAERRCASRPTHQSATYQRCHPRSP